MARKGRSLCELGLTSSAKRRQSPLLSTLFYKKVTAAAIAAAATVIEFSPQINEKTHSFRTTKFGTQIAFSIKISKMPSSKTQDKWGPHRVPPYY